MSVFTLPQAVKEERLVQELTALTAFHRAHCEPYDRILSASGYTDASGIPELPWLPVRLFKTLELKSIPDDEVFKVLTSSGTTGDVSKIYLDKAAAAEQQKRLAATVQTVLGPKRLPMILVDTKAMLKDRRSFSARGAGVLGMSTFGRDHVWALDMNGQVDLAALRGFLEKHGDQPFLIFGFTFLVWLHLYEVALEHGLDLSNGTLIHSGGWKKLIDQAVSPEEFRSHLKKVGLTRVHNYYGMVEQIGTIFLEGPDGGSLYCPDFADVVVRDPETWAELPPGKPGLLEVVSTLSTSYPGHVLLTEDLGVVHGIDDGDWPGKRFSVLGRLPRAEARGCSDTYKGA
ncbi:LuxE/PaaK family acyltransferase [Actinoplanes derwentensis]|uniref:Acyl-protein synthetase, LuxE n=1 Tax=Actinoplanes derwentensis TaxID=113562 RepID=A0A1H2CNC7_9ACTN|nr:acyl-protein synthetase [Actinoplanes derwentensis]GID88580.1 acyl-protein synthetase [Actinoplanes derwentensis]SDT71993.1 Acyl-protein synthetase, LuxE [Actinoplanes derwentensis]